MKSLHLNYVHKLTDDASKLLAVLHTPVGDAGDSMERVTVGYAYDAAAAKKTRWALRPRARAGQSGDRPFPWLYVFGDLLPGTHDAIEDWMLEHGKPRIVLPYLGKPARQRLVRSTKYHAGDRYLRFLKDGFVTAYGVLHIHVLPHDVKPEPFMRRLEGRFDPGNPPAGYHHWIREGDWLDWAGRFEMCFRITGAHHFGEMSAILRMSGSYIGGDPNIPTYALMCGGRHASPSELPANTHALLDAEGLLFDPDRATA